jgi:plastocyanin
MEQNMHVLRKKVMKNIMRDFVRLIFLSVFSMSLLLVNNGCKKSDDSEPSYSGGGGGSSTANEVSMSSNAFSPSSKTVAVNTTVTWRNTDSMTHTVTANNGAFNSGTINPGGTYSYTFTTAGTYEYHCTFHQGMTGTVIVQ